MVDVKKLDLLYFSNDKPVPYELSNGSNKGKIINIHPIKVVDWGIFEKCLDVLLQEKQDYDNEDIIMMSYLDFVLNILVPSSVEDDGESIFAEKLAKVLELSLKIENIKTGTYRNRTCLVFDDEIVLTSKEFDEIKKIILFQNLEDYDDRYVSPNVKKLYCNVNPISKWWNQVSDIDDNSILELFIDMGINSNDPDEYNESRIKEILEY